MGDLKAQPFVEAPGGIDFHHGQSDCLIGACGLANQPLHHLGADAPALKRAVYKHLRDKKLVIFRDSLDPADVDTVDYQDADLRRLPLLLETDFVSRRIQTQFVNDPLHLAEVETSAIIKILFESWAERHWHWFYSVADRDTGAHYRLLHPGRAPKSLWSGRREILQQRLRRSSLHAPRIPPLHFFQSAPREAFIPAHLIWTVRVLVEAVVIHRQEEPDLLCFLIAFVLFQEALLLGDGLQDDGNVGIRQLRRVRREGLVEGSSDQSKLCGRRSSPLRGSHYVFVECGQIVIKSVVPLRERHLDLIRLESLQHELCKRVATAVRGDVLVHQIDELFDLLPESIKRFALRIRSIS